jgi:Skp family chaperone for outer membrane proteins
MNQAGPPPMLFVPAFLLAVTSALSLACATGKPAQPTTAVQPSPEPVATPDPCEEVKREQKRLEGAAAALDREKQTLSDEVDGLKLKMVEKQAQVKQLEERQATLQATLDEAIQEVVRTKSKLRSIESRAEAASNIAEAEVALKAAESRATGGANDADLVKARQLLKMSGEEFKKQNYGGALYLAGQAKSHLNVGEARGGREKPAPVTGESSFAVPLPLQLTETSNVREGPGREFRVIATLPKGTKVLGYSQKDQWVRVRDESGTVGWVFRPLLGAR